LCTACVIRYENLLPENVGQINKKNNNEIQLSSGSRLFVVLHLSILLQEPLFIDLLKWTPTTDAITSAASVSDFRRHLTTTTLW